MDANRLSRLLNGGLGSEEMVPLFSLLPAPHSRSSSYQCFCLCIGVAWQESLNVDKCYYTSSSESLPFVAVDFVNTCCLLVCSACRCLSLTQWMDGWMDGQTDYVAD